MESRARFQRSHRLRPIGTTSRLHRPRVVEAIWRPAKDIEVPFPLLLDIQKMEAGAKEPGCRVECELDLVDGCPAITTVRLFRQTGLDVERLQRFFRWQTPLDVVRIMVPDLISRNIDPFDVDYPTEGFPDAAKVDRKPLDRLSDDFLSEIALQYKKIGRGYAKLIAEEFGVSPRTVVSWIEKARRRGILGPTQPGRIGGAVCVKDTDQFEADKVA